MPPVETSSASGSRPMTPPLPGKTAGTISPADCVRAGTRAFPVPHPVPQQVLACTEAVIRRLCPKPHSGLRHLLNAFSDCWRAERLHRLDHGRAGVDVRAHQGDQYMECLGQILQRGPAELDLQRDSCACA